MANTYYDSQLTAAEIEAVLEAINGILTPANNGKVLAINNGKFEARSVQWGGGGAVVQPLSVTQNGTYNPPSGVDGYTPVVVNVSGGGAGFVADEYSQFLTSVFDTGAPIESGNTIEVAFYANSYVNNGHVVGQSYSTDGNAFHLTSYSNRWYIGGTNETSFASDSDCPLSGADIVYKAKTGEVSMNGVIKTTYFTMPNQPSHTYKLNTRGGSVSTTYTYKYKYVKVYDSNNDLICHWEFGHYQLGNAIVYVGHEKVHNVYEFYNVAKAIQPLSVTQNGIYNPPADIDGYAPVSVNIPEKVIQPLVAMQNGTYNPPSGIDGYAPITVNVSGGGGGLSASVSELFRHIMFSNSANDRVVRSDRYFQRDSNEPVIFLSGGYLQSGSLVYTGYAGISFSSSGITGTYSSYGDLVGIGEKVTPSGITYYVQVMNGMFPSSTDYGVLQFRYDGTNTNYVFRYIPNLSYIMVDGSTKDFIGNPILIGNLYNLIDAMYQEYYAN